MNAGRFLLSASEVSMSEIFSSVSCLTSYLFFMHLTCSVLLDGDILFTVVFLCPIIREIKIRFQEEYLNVYN